ncbi:MAG TPA: response regulator [Syntrophales bacterium]|mgnify:CR=1 FL=1|nr:response regulator [Syntrophales bacterium]HQN77761.1 response regulator [Syntrophales bacterium]HQQ27050.1 response regulator [Syntrophales bacterium]
MTTRSTGTGPDRSLNERILYLEELYRNTLDALETASTLGDFQTSINKLQDPSSILREASERIRRIVPFNGLAFYLVNENTQDFEPYFTEPGELLPLVRKTVDGFIESGIFSWVLNQRRSVVLPSPDGKSRRVLHTLATCSRIRGMFIGLLPEEKSQIPDIHKSLLSIILLNCSNALESFELYHRIREIKTVLENRESYKTLFEAAPDGVEVLDGMGLVIDCNHSQETLLLRDRASIIGAHTTDFLSEPYRRSFEKFCAEMRKSGYAECEAEVLRSDGSVRQVWRKGKAIRDDAGDFLGAIIHNRDVTQLNRMEADRKEMELRLQRAQKMEALGTLAGGIAHDLNNILSGLVSYPELILMQLPPESPFRKPLQTIQRSGEKAAATVQDMLTMARRARVPSESVNVNQVVRDYLRSPEHEKLLSLYPEVQVDATLEPDLKYVVGAPVQIWKIVMNLVTNAFEAMPRGGSLSIVTGNRTLGSPFRGYEFIPEGRYVTLSVIDTGTGMGHEVLERIFEPFYTRKAMGRSGSGLGMAIVWGALKDHKGYIDLSSVEGKGTRFSLFFPASSRVPKKAGTVRERATPTGNGERLLVVDDEEQQREIATAMLSSLGYSVSSAATGPEAARHIRSHPTDLVILDMILGAGMDGLDTYREILQVSPGQKAIIASGFSESDRVRECLRLGAGAYLRKPYTIDAIGRCIRKELEK